MWDRWNDLFRNELSFVERSLISELRDFRNRWAHQDSIEEVDLYRILDDIERLLKAINSTETKFVTELRRESLRCAGAIAVVPSRARVVADAVGLAGIVGQLECDV